MRSIFVVAALLISCIASATDIRPLQTKITWSDKCLPDPPKPTGDEKLLGVGVAVVAILGPKIISAAVDSAATALTNAGKDKEVAKVNFSDDFSPYALTNEGDLVIPRDMRCVEVYWGKLDANGNKHKDHVLSFHARVDPVKGTTGYFRLTPIKLDVGEFAKSSTFSRNVRDYTISLTLSVPGADKPFASTTFVYNDVEPRILESKIGEVPNLRLESSRSEIMSFPPVPDSAKKAQTARNTDIAPYIIAADIIKQSEEAKKSFPFKKQPSVYEEASVPAEIKAYCDTLTAQNKDVLPKFAINDDLCAYKVTAAKKLVTDQLADHGRNGKTLNWANMVCAYGVDNNIPLDASGAKKEDKCPFVDLPHAATKKRYGIMTTSVTITEVRPGSKFAAKLGSVLSSSKDDLSKELSKRLVPSLRQAADAADEASDRSARRGVQLAEMKVQIANDLLAEALAANPVVPPDVSSARAAVFQSKIAANDAYRLAGQTVPYLEAD